MTSALSSPAEVQGRLEEIDGDLAIVQNALEAAAFRWFVIKRDREQQWAEAFVRAEGGVADRKAAADAALGEVLYPQSDGEEPTAGEAEGRFEALKAKARVLETRASIGQSILRAQSRVGA